MTDDLLAINELSEQFKSGADQKEPIAAYVHLHEQGRKIRRMYESQPAYDPDVQRSKAVHLHRLAHLYYRVFNPTLFHAKQSTGQYGSISDPAPEQYRYFVDLCSYAVEGFEAFPNANSALLLADAYRLVDFYGTSIYWCKQAEEVASANGQPDLGTKARALRLDLEADGKTADPQLSLVRFPTSSCPGLRPELQPPDQSLASPLSRTTVPTNTSALTYAQHDTPWKAIGAAFIVLAFVAHAVTPMYLLSNMLLLIGVGFIIKGFLGRCKAT